MDEIGKFSCQVGGFHRFAVAATAGMALTAIDTNSSWNGTTFISSFGNPNTATYGQTVTVPGSENTLNSFSFWIRGAVATTPIPFQGAVFKWDAANSRAIGAPVWESAPVMTIPDGTFHKFVFTPFVAVEPGAQYVLAATTSRNQAAPALTQWGSVGINTAYSGGQFVFINNGSDVSQWSGNSWSTLAADLAFTAEFGATAVPTLDPAMMLLLALLMVIGGFVTLRRYSLR